MRKIYYLLLLATFIFSISSCQFFREESNSTEEKPKSTQITTDNSDSTKSRLAKQDSINHTSSSKITNETDKKDSSKHLYHVIFGLTLLLIFILLLTSYYLFHNRKPINEDKIKEIVQQKIDDFFDKEKRKDRQKMEQKERLQGGFSQKTDNKEIEQRINNLEKKIQQLMQQINLNDHPSQSNIQKKEEQLHNENNKTNTKTSQIGYAKINSDEYFLEIFESKVEGCVYAIEFNNHDEGQFDLININAIKSRNGWQKIIEYAGICTIDDANDYKLINKGICKRCNDNKAWHITSKLRIEIIK